MSNEQAGRDLSPLWTRLAERAGTDAATNIGFPGATDITHEQLGQLLTSVLYNNIGSPYDTDGHGRNHTRDIETEVVNLVADLFHAPPTRWGYVTGGATEGTEHALLDARRRYPNAVAFASAASHFKINTLVDKLMMPLVVINTEPGGAMDIDDLAGELARRRDRPAIIVATAGTTMTEAVDDVPAIVNVCDQLALTRRRIHVDAALSGLPLALEPVNGVPRIDFSVRGVDSVIISGHKFLSTLVPCGVLVYRQPPIAASAGRVSYTGTVDATIAGSRSGHTTLLLMASLAGIGAAAHRERVRASRATAAYAVNALRRIGVDAARHAHGFTVYFPPPPPALNQRWVIPADDQYGHIVCMPQVTRAQIDALVSDFQAVMRGRELPEPATRLLAASAAGPSG